jgi:glycosyltransferase involved in cell wall biosynthesis
LYDRLIQLAEKLTSRYAFEFIFTDNHSEDETFDKLSFLAAKDERVRIIRFSRNFGFQRSILTNFLSAKGDAAVQIDCDLQDPPEMIEEFLARWEKGYKVVYGVRKSRPNENVILFGLRKVFYYFIDKISEHPLPRNAGDFRLIDRCIIDELEKIDPYQPYLRGAIATFGFPQIGIEYDRFERARGISKFSLSDLVRLAIDGIVSHSINPLRLATYAGFSSFLIAIFGGLYYFIGKLFFAESWPEGLASSSILILFSIGINGIFLGLMGEYISRIYRSMIGGSFTIIQDDVNVPAIKKKESAKDKESDNNSEQ